METRTKVPTKTSFKVPSKIIQGGSDFLTDILFPRHCPACGDIVLPKGNLICPGCIAKPSWVRRPVCKKYEEKMLDETIEYCHDCVRHERGLDYGLSLINYDDTASRSMARTKYNNRKEYLDFCNETMVGKVGKRTRSTDEDALTLVPVHPSRLRERGFNQAEELACRLSGPLGILVSASALKRERRTAPQEDLDSNGRSENLEQAFMAAALPSATQKAIPVDDIYTAGSTIEACARILRKIGAEYVYFTTIFIGHGQ